MIVPCSLLSTMLLLAQGQPASQPASPSADADRDAASDLPKAGGTAGDVQAQITMIHEFAENVLNTSESWTLENASGRVIEAKELTIEMPPGARRLQLKDAAGGFAAAENARSIDATGPMGDGAKQIEANYQIEFQGSTAVVRRRIPFEIARGRLIMEDLSDLSVSANVALEKRTRDFNGLRFAIHEFSARRGTELEITIRGLPSRTLWPRRIAVIGVIVVLAWMVWSLWTRRVPGRESRQIAGPLSPGARRDQIVRAIELLDRDYREGKITDQRYNRRSEELMHELSRVLRELDLAKA